MTREELFDVLRPHIVSVTGVSECILADPNAPAPDGNYCAVEPFSSFVEVGQRGQKQELVDSVDGNTDYQDIKITVMSCKEVTVSINFYRGDARDQAAKVAQMNMLPSVAESMLINGLGWLGVSPARNLTELNQGLFEPRYQIDLYLLMRTEISETVQAIYTAGVEVQNESGDTIASFETD
jgi:hypothetical protein